MKSYEEFIAGLQEDVEVPDDVSKKFNKSLAELPDATTRKSKNGVRKWMTAVASTAAVLALSTGFLMANPVLAAKIPIIGKIFERVEDKVTYSGDYKDKADVLTAEPEVTEAVDADNVTNDEKASEVAANSDTTYVVEDKGMTFTASEVYCDGHSLYLTAKVESADGGFTNMFGYVEEEGIERLYAWGEGQTDNGVVGINTGQGLEGEVIDDNTFVGMMKIDFDQVVTDGGTFDLKLSMLGFDSYESMKSEDIDVGHRYDGNWELSIPYTVDTESAKVIEVNEDTGVRGIKIDKIFVSPYQILVYMDASFTQPNLEAGEESNAQYEEEAIAQYEELWSEKNEEIVAAGYPEDAVTYEEWRNDKVYDNEWDITLFNQDGERLQCWDISLKDDQWVARCAVEEKDVSELQIFVGNEWLTFKMNTLEEAKENADFSTVVKVK